MREEVSLKSKMKNKEYKAYRTWNCRQKCLVGIFVTILYSLAIVLSSPELAFAKNVSSSDLVEKCRYYDGREVTYQGEIVGDIMVRGKYAWVNVNDDSYSTKHSVEEDAKLKGYNSGQSIWCEASQVEDLKHAGNYQTSGDIVWIKGTFHRACAEHGGDMDIHASEVKLVKRGHTITHTFDWQKALIALVLAVLSGILFVAYKLLDRKKVLK